MHIKQKQIYIYIILICIIIMTFYLDKKLDLLTKQMMLVLLGHEQPLDVLFRQN